MLLDLEASMGEYEEALLNLRKVKQSMNIVILKHKEDKESQKKRIEYLKAQTYTFKEEFRQEYGQVKKDDIEYNKVHNELINMEKLYRKACQYVNEKEQSMKIASSNTYFPSFKQNKEEHNGHEGNEQVLSQVKSYDKLTTQRFFKNRKQKKNNLFSPQRTRNIPFMNTARTSKFSTVDKIEIDPEKIDSLITKKEKISNKKLHQLMKLKLKTNNLNLENKKKEIGVKGIDREIKAIELKIINLGMRLS